MGGSSPAGDAVVASSRPARSPGRPSRRLARGRAATMAAAPICITACCCACPARRRPLPPAALLLRYAARGAEQLRSSCDVAARGLAFWVAVVRADVQLQITVSFEYRLLARLYAHAPVKHSLLIRDEGGRLLSRRRCCGGQCRLQISSPCGQGYEQNVSGAEHACRIQPFLN